MSWEEEYANLIGLPVVIDNSYDQPRTPETVTQDIVTARQDVGTSSNDSWGGFFQSALGQVLSYGIRKDAVQTTAALQQQPRAATTTGSYAPAAAQSAAAGLSFNQLLLIGGIVVAVLAFKK